MTLLPKNYFYFIYLFFLLYFSDDENAGLQTFFVLLLLKLCEGFQRFFPPLDICYPTLCYVISVFQFQATTND